MYLSISRKCHGDPTLPGQYKETCSFMALKKEFDLDILYNKVAPEKSGQAMSNMENKKDTMQH
jgi:hypothetical protein